MPDGYVSSEQEMSVIIESFEKFLARRGVEIDVRAGRAEIVKALQSLDNVVKVVSKPPKNPDTIIDGVRTFDRPVVGVFYPPISGKKNRVDTTKFERTLARIGKEHPGHLIIIVGKPDRLRDALLDRVATFIREKGFQIVYRSYRMFITDLPAHDHARCVRHRILTPEEAAVEKSFYRKYAEQFAPIPVGEPLCVWTGVRAGDMVKITGGATGASTCNIRVATSALRPTIGNTSL